jgi:hypothetical protein
LLLHPVFKSFYGCNQRVIQAAALLAATLGSTALLATALFAATLFTATLFTAAFFTAAFFTATFFTAAGLATATFLGFFHGIAGISCIGDRLRLKDVEVRRCAAARCRLPFTG